MGPWLLRRNEAHEPKQRHRGERPAEPPQRPVSVAVLLARFTAAGTAVLIVLAAALALAARQEGTERAIGDAQLVTRIAGEAVIGPLLTPELLTGDQAALARFDTTVRRSVLTGSLVRVKLWSADGQVLYSDEPRLRGARFPLDPEELAALTQQGSDAEVSDLSRPENQFEAGFGKLLEVYQGIRAVDGTPALFEAYFRYDTVRDAGLDAWRTFAPPALGALLLLQVVQVPFAWTLARRIQRGQRQRELLLRQAVDASDSERRRIAAELHDGVVQELTGITYTLDASARRERRDREGDRPCREVAAESARTLRGSVAALRSLLVDMYPLDIAQAGLASGLEQLATDLEHRGITVGLHTDHADTAPPDAAQLLYRAAQEITRNIATHSGAEHVEITCGLGPTSAHLVVDDDGRGFDAQQLAERTDAGHVGLRGIGDLVRDAHGRLRLRSAPGQGTRIEIEVPLT